MKVLVLISHIQGRGFEDKDQKGVNFNLNINCRQKCDVLVWFEKLCKDHLKVSFWQRLVSRRSLRYNSRFSPCHDPFSFRNDLFFVPINFYKSKLFIFLWSFNTYTVSFRQNLCVGVQLSEMVCNNLLQFLGGHELSCCIYFMANIFPIHNTYEVNGNKD